MKKLLIVSIFVLQSIFGMLALAQPVQHTNTHSPRFNLFFLGESCAGKTTLMQQLCMLSDQFFIPKFTTTRSARLDDDPELLEFVTVKEYLQSRNRDEFIFDMDDGNTYYGYKKQHWHVCDKHALLYGSPYFIEQARALENALLILIEADKEKGFLERHDPTPIKETRRRSNEKLSDLFFSRDSFRQKMDLIYYNTFGNAQASTQQLLETLHGEILHN